MSNRTTLADLRGMDAAQAAACRPLISPCCWTTPRRCEADAKHVSRPAARRAASPLRRRRRRAPPGRGQGYRPRALPRRRLRGRRRSARSASEWDQPQLAAAIATLRGWGEDPADYVATEIKVPESRFTAWPPTHPALFQPARTVGTGRPSYALEQMERRPWRTNSASASPSRWRAMPSPAPRTSRPSSRRSTASPRRRPRRRRHRGRRHQGQAPRREAGDALMAISLASLRRSGEATPAAPARLWRRRRRQDPARRRRTARRSSCRRRTGSARSTADTFGAAAQLRGGAGGARRLYTEHARLPDRGARQPRLAGAADLAAHRAAQQLAGHRAASATARAISPRSMPGAASSTA